MSNVVIKPSSPSPAYASANVLASTCTRELPPPIKLSYSILDTSVIVVPSADMSNVVIKPSSPSPAYASANVSASTCTRELYSPLKISCSILDTSVIVVPSADMSNVVIKPSSS